MRKSAARRLSELGGLTEQAASEAKRRDQVLPGVEHPCCRLSNTPDLELKPADYLELLPETDPKLLHKVQHPSLISI